MSRRADNVASDKKLHFFFFLRRRCCSGRRSHWIRSFDYFCYDGVGIVAAVSSCVCRLLLCDCCHNYADLLPHTAAPFIDPTAREPRCTLPIPLIPLRQLLGYAKVIGTLVRAMRVLAVAVRAVPKATRVLRLAAVFIRSYEGRRRSKDLHEASIVIQRRAGRHMALKVRRVKKKSVPCM